MDIEQQLRRDEGVRYRPYTDSLGFRTIGIGHKILPSENFSDLVPITDPQVTFIFEQDLDTVVTQLAQYSWYQLLDEVRQGSMQNMAFNLGVSGLLHFVSMLHYLSIGDWVNAAAECLASVWADQVGDRAKRIAQQILKGEWV